MRFNHLLVEKKEYLATVYINRPDKLNALNHDVLEELHHLFSVLQVDDSVRVIVLTGSGEKAFVAGADIAEFARFDSSQGKELARKGQELVFDVIANMTKPVIAAINGFALGGGLELALSCHLRVAATHAKMGLPETSLGVIPGYGGTQRLAQLIGRGRATELILTGAMINAEEALEYGLISSVVPQEELALAAEKMAAKINKNSPNAIRHALQSIADGYAHDKDGFESEINHFGACFGHPEFIEGTTAFMEKRKANF